MTKLPENSETLELRYENLPVGNILPPPGTTESESWEETNPPPLLLLPPVVNETEDKKYRIVDGLQSFRRALGNGEEVIRCGIVTPRVSTSREACLRLYLNPGRMWNNREKISLVDTIISSEEPIDREMLSKTGISPADIKAIRYLQSCPRDVLEAVASERIHLGVVREFRVLSSEDRASFLDAVTGLSASLQMQRELLEWCSEIASGQSISVTELLETPTVQKTLTNTTLNAPQRIRKLRGTLFALRFPRFNAARQEWDKRAREISTVGGVTLNPDSAFEKNRLEVKIVLNSADRAREVFGKLSKVSESTWEVLISPFNRISGSPTNPS